MQIALTALVTILVGALTLVVGQIIVSGALDHALELKRLIGTIAHDMDFYATKFLQCKPEEQQAWRAKFREHAYSLRDKLAFIIWYRIFETIFRLPPKNAVREASYQLIGYSNHPAEPPWKPLPEEIKELLRIKTSDSLIRADETPSSFDQPGQRNAFRRRDVRLQSRSFVRWNANLQK
jgi:hypothetical protein